MDNYPVLQMALYAMEPQALRAFILSCSDDDLDLRWLAQEVWRTRRCSLPAPQRPHKAAASPFLRIAHHAASAAGMQRLGFD